MTTAQFRQCLTMLELHCSEPEMIALEAKFCNDTGFNYIAFLEELQPQDPQQFMYEKRLEEIRKTNQRKSLPELNAQKDLEGVLLKVKTKVCIALSVLIVINPLVTTGFSHDLDESTFIFRGFCSNFSFLFHFSMKII